MDMDWKKQFEILLHCWVIWKVAESPPSLRHSGASFWRPFWRFGYSIWRFPTWRSRQIRAPHRGGGWLGFPSRGLSPKHKELVFCLVLLNYMTSGPFSWCYILILTQRFFWYFFSRKLMAILCCVAQKAASAAQVGIVAAARTSATQGRQQSRNISDT